MQASLRSMRHTRRQDGHLPLDDIVCVLVLISSNIPFSDWPGTQSERKAHTYVCGPVVQWLCTYQLRAPGYPPPPPLGDGGDLSRESNVS